MSLLRFSAYSTDKQTINFFKSKIIFLFFTVNGLPCQNTSKKYWNMNNRFIRSVQEIFLLVENQFFQIRSKKDFTLGFKNLIGRLNQQSSWISRYKNFSKKTFFGENIWSCWCIVFFVIHLGFQRGLGDFSIHYY